MADRCNAMMTRTLQLSHLIEVEQGLSARRERNRLRYAIWDLETDFTTPQFEKLKKRAILLAQVSGLDENRLTPLYKAGRSRIERAAFDAVDPLRAEHLKARYGIDLSQDYRNALTEKLSIAYLTCLIQADREEADRHLTAFVQGLEKFSQAEQLNSLSQVEMLEAQQELASSLLSAVPVLSDALDILAVGTGEDPLTGKKLSAAERWVNFLLMATPEFIDAMIKKSPAIGITLDKLSKTKGKGAHALATRLNLSPGQMDDLMAKAGRAVHTREEKMGFLKASAQKKLAGYNPAHDPIWKQGMEQANETLTRLETALIKNPAGPEALEAYQALRKDKFALTRIQDSQFLDLRLQTRSIEDELFSSVSTRGSRMGKVDEDAIAAIRKDLGQPTLDETLTADLTTRAKAGQISEQERMLLEQQKAKQRVQAQVRQHQYQSGVNMEALDDTLDFDTLEITVFNATNKPPAADKIGFDRDITYQITIPEKKVVVQRAKGPETVIVPEKVVDIPAAIVEPHYNKALYTRLNPGQAPPSTGRLKTFGEDMDHAVTDALSKEAYRLNVKKIQDFFADPTLLRNSPIEVENFVSTVMHKSEEWFERAREAQLAGQEGVALFKTGEGMRQAAKQYENYMTPLLDHYGMTPDLQLSPTLVAGIDVFQAAGEGRISPSQASEILEALGTNPDQIVDLLGHSFENIVKFGIKVTP